MKLTTIHHSHPPGDISPTELDEFLPDLKLIAAKMAKEAKIRARTRVEEDELLSEGYLAARLGLPTYQPHKGSLGAWTRFVARRAMKKFCGKMSGSYEGTTSIAGRRVKSWKRSPVSIGLPAGL